MEIFRLQVKKSIPFVSAVIDGFGDDSYVYFCGDFSVVDLSGIATLSIVQEKGSNYDDVAFPLTNENKAAIKALLPRIGIHKRIIHIEIERCGYLVFGAYDQFAEDCVWVTANIGKDFMLHLVNQHIIRKYELVEVKDRQLQSSIKVLNFRN
jgi:hypothetical protein